jgi:HindIII-like restriction endonuclease
LHYSDVPKLISGICSKDDTSFKKKTDELFALLNSLDRPAVAAHVEYGGVIPESYSHDSTEEKLFAKYCDYLLAKALSELGMKATVIEERADAADVIAKVRGYALVGDAKAFRLSRTAKNQKDFKVEALNQWKKDANYACLVCPLYQYPAKSSQIYDQAIRYSVTLLSFTHLGFLLRAKAVNEEEFDKLWTVSGGLSSAKSAVDYWKPISHQVALAAGSSLDEWEKYLLNSKKLLHEQAMAQLLFWESEKVRIRGLALDEAVEALISALRIESNIEMITTTIAHLEGLIDQID